MGIINYTAIEPEILNDIDIFIENFYQQSIIAGNELARVELSHSQVRNLETLISSTNRFSEVINFIKKQIGKEKDNKWLQSGTLLLSQLEQIEAKTDSMKNLCKINDIALNYIKTSDYSVTIEDIKPLTILPYLNKDTLRDKLYEIISNTIETKDQSEIFVQTVLNYSNIDLSKILIVKMHLTRKWFKQVSTHYFFKVALTGNRAEE